MTVKPDLRNIILFILLYYWYLNNVVDIPFLFYVFIYYILFLDRGYLSLRKCVLVMLAFLSLFSI